MEKKFDLFLSEGHLDLKPGSQVLIVDADHHDRAAARRVLEQKGWQVTEACSGEEALRLIEHLMPSLVFLELKMPGMSGADVLRRIRELRPDLPVVILTGYTNARLLDDVTKLSPTLLLSKVTSYCRAGKPAWMGLAEPITALAPPEEVLNTHGATLTASGAP